MAAFSTLALLGLGLAGGMGVSTLANRNKNKQPMPAQSVAQQPAAAEPIVPPPPVPAPQAQSDATKIAKDVGQRQRRRAGPISTTMPVGRRNPSATPIMQPERLLGY